MPGVIIVGVDGTEASLRAGAYAVGMARRQGSRLVGVFVRPLAGSALSFADPFGASITSAFANHDVAGLLQKENVDFDVLTRNGDPFTELCQVATEMWADAVIVGRSRSALSRITGSVAQRLVRCGRWPVTVIP